MSDNKRIVVNEEEWTEGNDSQEQWEQDTETIKLKGHFSFDQESVDLSPLNL